MGPSLAFRVAISLCWVLLVLGGSNTASNVHEGESIRKLLQADPATAGGGGGLSTQDTQALGTALQQAASSRDSGTSTSSSLIQFINTAYSLLNNADAISPGTAPMPAPALEPSGAAEAPALPAAAPQIAQQLPSSALAPRPAASLLGAIPVAFELPAEKQAPVPTAEAAPPVDLTAAAPIPLPTVGPLRLPVSDQALAPAAQATLPAIEAAQAPIVIPASNLLTLPAPFDALTLTAFQQAAAPAAAAALAPIPQLPILPVRPLIPDQALAPVAGATLPRAEVALAPLPLPQQIELPSFPGTSQAPGPAVEVSEQPPRSFPAQPPVFEPGMTAAAMLTALAGGVPLAPAAAVEAAAPAPSVVPRELPAMAPAPQAESGSPLPAISLPSFPGLALTPAPQPSATPAVFPGNLPSMSPAAAVVSAAYGMPEGTAAAPGPSFAPAMAPAAAPQSASPLIAPVSSVAVPTSAPVEAPSPAQVPSEAALLPPSSAPLQPPPLAQAPNESALLAPSSTPLEPPTLARAPMEAALPPAVMSVPRESGVPPTLAVAQPPLSSSQPLTSAVPTESPILSPGPQPAAPAPSPDMLAALIASLIQSGAVTAPTPAPAPAPASAAAEAAVAAQLSSIFLGLLPGLTTPQSPAVGPSLASAAPPTASDPLQGFFSQLLPGLSGSPGTPSAAVPFNTIALLEAFLPLGAAAPSAALPPTAAGYPVVSTPAALAYNDSGLKPESNAESGTLAPAAVQIEPVVVLQPPAAAPSMSINPFTAIFQNLTLGFNGTGSMQGAVTAALSGGALFGANTGSSNEPVMPVTTAVDQAQQVLGDLRLLSSPLITAEAQLTPQTPVQRLVTTVLSQATNLSASLGLDSLSGVPLAQAFADVELLMQELQQIMSLDSAANDPRKALVSIQAAASLHAALDDTCTAEKLELPKLEGPFCVGESYQLALVPWSCALNDDTAILTCTPAYLALITTPDTCSVLKIFEGSFTGRECGVIKQFGSADSKELGTPQITYKVSDILSKLQETGIISSSTNGTALAADTSSAATVSG